MPHGSWAGSYPGATPLRFRARRVWRTLKAADYRPPPLVTRAQFLVAPFGRPAAREQGRGDGRQRVGDPRAGCGLRPGAIHRRVGAAWPSQLMVAGKRVAQDAGSPVLAI